MVLGKDEGNYKSLVAKTCTLNKADVIRCICRKNNAKDRRDWVQCQD